MHQTNASGPEVLPVPAPATTLDYSPPPAASRKVGAGVFFCAVAGAFFSGFGFFVFGGLMMFGISDDHAGPVAVGASAMLLGGMLFATAAWLRKTV